MVSRLHLLRACGFGLFMLGFLAVVSRADAQDFVKEVTPLPAPRMMHGSAILNGFLYVVGGARANAAPDLSVVKSPILADGSLGAWTASTPLPHARLYIGTSTLALNDKLYVLGGSKGVIDAPSYNTVLYTSPDAAGNLALWKESVPCPGPGIDTPSCVATPGFIHIIGGLDTSKVAAGVPVSSVYSLQLDAQGVPENWVHGNSLPVALWYQNCAVASGRVYVWGGLLKSNSRSGTKLCYSAPILATGELGAWRAEAQQLPEPIYGASVAVAGPYLISLCPRLTGAVPTNSIYWTSASKDGLQPWQVQKTRIVTRLYHASAQDYRGGTVYLTGGRSSLTDQASLVSKVYSFSLTAQAREDAYEAARSAPGGGRSVSLHEVARAGTGAKPPAALPAQQLRSALAKFRPIEEARGSRRPMLMYFHAADSIPCTEQVGHLDAETVAALADRFSLVLVDPRELPQFAQNRGIYRVPTWVVFDAQGNELDRRIGVMTSAQLKGLGVK